MFRAGSTKYLVKIMPEPIVMDGAECDGVCDARTRTIKLSPTLPIDRRFPVMLHELMHAWLFSVGGRPIVDAEDACDLWATAAEQMLVDVVAAGGVEALLRLRPGEEFGLATAKIGLLRSRTCGTCGGLVAPGDIDGRRVTGTGDACELAMWCEHCDLTQRWRERLTPAGAPSGEVVGDPRIERGNTLHLDLSRDLAHELA